MDNVARLLDSIAKMPEVSTLDRRAAGFLNDIAEIYERQGAGTTRVYLLNQRSKKREAPLLLKVIERLEACPEVRTNRAIGRQIIKCLFELKEGEKR
jgi:hypothetical protein